MRHFVGFELKMQKWPRGDNIIVDVLRGASMNTDQRKAGKEDTKKNAEKCFVTLFEHCKII